MSVDDKPRIEASVPMDLSEGAIYQAASMFNCFAQDIIAVRAPEWYMRSLAEFNGRRHALGYPPVKFEALHPSDLKEKGLGYWEVETPTGIFWSNPRW